MSKIVLRWGALTCLAALAFLTQNRAVAADDTASDLELVPADSPGFVTLRVSDIWDDPSVKDFIKKTASGEGRDFFKDAEKELGFSLNDVARVTIVLPPMLDDNESPPFFIVTTSKPLDKAKVQAALTPKGEESKSASGKVFIQDKDKHAIVHFVGEKTVFIGKGKWALAYLDKKLDTKAEGRYKGAKELAAKNTLAGILDLADYSKELQKNLTKDFKGIDALFEAKPALVTITGGKDLTLACKWSYKNEDGAKDAATAAKALRDQMVAMLIEQEKQFALLADNPDFKKNEKAVAQFKEMLALMKDVEEALKKTEIDSKGKDVNVALHSQLSPAKIVTRWFLMLGSTSEKSSGKPAEKPPAPPKDK
jgi:hypothetical protein